MSVTPEEKFQTGLMLELEGVAEKELDRHLAGADEWFPHQYVPWNQGRDFDGPLGGDGWEPGDSKLDGVARESLIVNLLTEDNLPGYHRAIADVFGRDGAWGTWVNRWTAEENRHGIVIRDYLTVTRAVDPIALERARMKHMEMGYEAAHGTAFLHGTAYVSFQELATRVAHRNTGRASGDPLCEQMLARVAKDENLHMIFYRNMVDAALEVAPNETMRAITEVVKNFEMPGHGIEGFLRKSVIIANAGIYDLRLHHDDVVQPCLRKWRIWDREFTGDGAKARDELAEFVAALDDAATKFETRREERRARQAAKQK
ncbi:acyl-ACP desaturase [Actinomadura flavalba]|uniref:acyl-ACP desaturase n=1 Tax=Actinomadura flavalba TaxID=1120938 RepID=UPI00037A7A9E|nr:acyl-ACP desaturase [Actinomadura flavalba]